MESRLGYSFRDPGLASLAFTHLSAQSSGGQGRAQSYQRLEFLGDRVLGVVIASRLYQAFPQASEGELSMRFAKLVRRETCAEIAAEWDVGPHVALGLGEAEGGGRKKAAILSDVCESLIGAVFVDGGFEAAEALILAPGATASPPTRARARRQDRGAGMGPVARACRAPLRGGRAQRPGARAPFRDARGARRLRAGSGRGELETGRRTGRRAGLSRPLGRDVSETRCGFVALIGAPNAGKSTLINALVGEKVSIVTRKAQTTRSTVRGVLTKGEAQIVFVDTPGLFAPKRRLDRAMVASAWGAAADADVLALMIDARKEAGQASRDRGDPGDPERARREPEAEARRPQQDRPRRAAEAPGARGPAQRRARFDDTFMISAATGDGLDRLTARLIELMPPGPWLYPEDQIAEAPIRSLAAEITREKLIERLHDELPYQATVETDSWKDLPDGSARIEQTIFVTRESHRKIVLGEGGRTIKAIGTAARKDIAAGPRRERASLPARQGARELARRPRALPRDGARVPEGVGPRQARKGRVVSRETMASTRIKEGF